MSDFTFWLTSHPGWTMAVLLVGTMLGACIGICVLAMPQAGAAADAPESSEAPSLTLDRMQRMTRPTRSSIRRN